MGQKVILICSECLSRNHSTTLTKMVRKDGTPITEIKKFCPKCGKHTVHKISK